MILGPVFAGTGLAIPTHDYESYNTSGSTTDIITFKRNGSGGTTVATLTIVYTDSTKATVSSITKT